jgi:Flp pilus assembly secretin CpaC
MGFLEATEDLRTPQTDILRTDPTTWERAKRRSAAKAPDIIESPDDAAVRQEVRTRKVPPRKFTAETGSYDEVKNLLQTLTNIPIIITPEAREVITSESLTLEMELIADLSVENFLNQMVGKSANLAWIIKNAVVQITSKAKAGGDKILVTHDVRDLVFQRTDFLPPTIRDLPSGDTSTGPRTGGEADEKVAFIEPDQIQLAIREATGTANWEGDGAASMEFAEGGYLIVTANPTLQQAVQQFLDDQRRFATAVVTIDSKFLTVSQNFLQQIGVDWRGLGGSGQKGSVATLDDVTNRLDDNSSRGLDNGGTGDPAGHPLSGLFFNDGGDGDVRARTENYFQSSLGRVLSPLGGATIGFTLLDDTELAGLLRAVEKRDNVQVVNSQLLTVMNTERANVAVINQTSFVRDFDVEVAQASFIADPKVDVIQDGIVLDVRPVIRWDRKHIHLQLSPTVAELQRPIPTFTTSLAGSTLPVTLQLPVLTVRSFATTVDVPDGGSVLIGGLRELLQKERRAEIPLLGGIPLIGFFFKEEGVVDENNSLMVLVTARITDIKDVVEGR